MRQPSDKAPLTVDTREQLVERMAEAQAKRISDEIDEQIRREMEQTKDTVRVKVLLVGQSESGKTAMMKMFRLRYSRKGWSEEKASWRPVVFLNLVRNVNTILSHLSSEMFNDISYDADDSKKGLQAPRPPRTFNDVKFTDKHQRLWVRLAPLANIQRVLEKQLGLASLDLQSTSVKAAALFDQDKQCSSSMSQYRGVHESTLALLMESDPEDGIALELATYQQDIKELWEDDVVMEVLSRQKVRLEDKPGFFIKDADRIARRDYQPTDDDVLRAHLRTLGVQEYRFIVNHGESNSCPREWTLYDINGTRSNRAVWYPYFDDADAIIFLAPVSTFDEWIAEGPNRINKFEDSYLLWRSVCSSKLLARVPLILFFNKCDLLWAKLQRGVQIRDSLPSFGNRPNDTTTAVTYFRQHFRAIHRERSVQRTFYCHNGSIDTYAAVKLGGDVGEAIFRQQLLNTSVM